jgi:hypothetical protein
MVMSTVNLFAAVVSIELFHSVHFLLWGHQVD